LEPKGNKTGRDKDEDAHEHAQKDVNKGGKEAGISSAPKKFAKSAKLNDRNNKHDYGHKDGEIAVCL
jgi:hypothetical protein